MQSSSTDANTSDPAAIIAPAIPNARQNQIEPLRGRTLSIDEDPDVWQIRSRLKITRAEFATAFGLPAGTVENWEQGHTKPGGAAKMLLALIGRKPVQVLLMLFRGRPVTGNQDPMALPAHSLGCIHL